MRSSVKYQEWCSTEFRLFDLPTPAVRTKVNQEKENVSCLMKEKESIKLVRESSSGDNIFDAERQVFSKNSDGTVKRSVIKETYARVTLREKRKSEDEVSGYGQIKRARKISNILDHTSGKDKQKKASLMAKIIDHEGPEFGANLEKESKVLQAKKKLNPEQTASMMTNSGSTDYSWRVNRTVFLNTLGYSPISSQKEVEKVRKRIMAVNKEDWAFLKMNIYQNKQGKLTFANFTLPSVV